MPTRAREVQQKVGPSRADQVARIKAALAYRGMQKNVLAKRMKASRNTITAHLTAKSSRPISEYYLRKYEEALGLPRLALDSGSPAEITALLTSGPHRASASDSAPFQGKLGDLDAAFRFVRSQLEGYRTSGRLVQPQVVAIWFNELETAASAAGPSREREPATSENVS